MYPLPDCKLKTPEGFQANKIGSFTSLETETNETVFGKKLTKRWDKSLRSANELSPNNENIKSQMSHHSKISKSSSCFQNGFDATHLAKSPKAPGKPIYVSRFLDLLALTCLNFAFPFFLVIDRLRCQLSSQIPEKCRILSFLTQVNLTKPGKVLFKR